MKQDKEDNEDSVRLDKWLWAARFFKTRALAAEAIKGGKVDVSNSRAKPSHLVKIDEIVSFASPRGLYTVKVLGISNQRGSASVASKLYEETEESRKMREELAVMQKLSHSIAPRERPDTKARRALRKLKEG
jgi:ribosome-associated heat shock protein Hsp15